MCHWHWSIYESEAGYEPELGRSWCADCKKITANDVETPQTCDECGFARPCNWETRDGSFPETELAHIPFGGGVQLDVIAMEEAWRKAQPFLVSWGRRHPDRAMRAVVYSCMGPQLTRFLDEREDRKETGW